MTWEELKELKVGTILHSELNEGLKFIIVRGPSSLCAYIGLPLNHPLAGHNYNLLPINCHCGLTYSGTDVCKDEGLWWYGWDYGHSGDYNFYYDDIGLGDHNKKWLVEDVKKDSWSALYDMEKLRTLAEQIFMKSHKWR
jgi:hypothetical protein